MNKKWKMSALAVTGMMLAACGEDLPEMGEGEESSGTSVEEVDVSDGNTLMVGMTNAPDSFNPFNRPGVAGTWAQRFMYDSILDMPTETEFEPKLGTLETEDNQVFTVTVAEDAYWTDGEPITADDVAFTLNTIADPEVTSSLGTSVSMIEGTTSSGERQDEYEELPGVQVVDERTVEIITKEPVDLAYISEFLGFHVLIAPEHVFAEIPKEEIATSDAVTSPTVFSGAYEFVEYQEEDYLHLEANEDYHRGAPQINEVFMRVMNGTALLTEFQAGNLHMAAGGGIGMVSHEDIPLLEEIEGLEVEEYPSLNIHYMIIDTTNPRFEDPQVRQALAHAIDKESIVHNLMDDRAEVVPSMYSSANPYQDEELEPYEYNPELAQEMLQDAGFDFEEEIDFVVPTGNAIREQTGDLIEQWLSDIGLNVRQSNYDFTTWLSMAGDQDYDLGLMGLGHNVDPNLQSYISTDGVSNYTAYSNERVDQLIEEGNAGTDFDERYPIYQELQEFLYEEIPLVPLYSDSQFRVNVDYLDGGMDPYWAGSLHDVHEWTLNP